ncbi:MAG: DUF2478 domain-containing protein [Candidatus Aminicenantes bacterium]|nr:DUF2478 domain-containing protein [Candidatus Aminicenantes bacterium]
MLFILTGPLHSGKTTLLKNIVQVLENKNMRIDGFLSQAVNKNDDCIGYDLFDLKNKKSFPYMRKSGKDKWIQSGSYFLIQKGLMQAKKIISRKKDIDIFIVDEVGPLELSGKGLFPELEKLIREPVVPLLIVVQSRILESFLSLFSLTSKQKTKIFDIRVKNASASIIQEIQTAR